LGRLAPKQRFVDDASLEAAYVAATPMGRNGEMEDVANLALFLLSDAAAFITGQVISVDAGRR